MPTGLSNLAARRTSSLPGTGFPLARAVLALNSPDAPRRAEVVVMSRNSTETSLRIFNSIRHYGLDITRAALSGGAPLAPYLRAFKVDLFLSRYEDDVRRALDAGVAAALLYDQPEDPREAAEEIRIAFDGDAILFSDESEKIFQADGLEAFARHEQARAREPLAEGPFARLLHKLSGLQQAAARDGITPIRTALVTARGGPAHERVIRTLLAWGIVVDEAFFLGGVPKTGDSRGLPAAYILRRPGGALRARRVAGADRAGPVLSARLALLVLVLLAAGCSRIDSLRLAHANGGTPVAWPSGEASLELEIRLTEDGRPWLPVSVDGSPVVPFLLQASAGAIALTGARASGFGPVAAGRLTLQEHLLPGIPGGRLIKQRRLELGALALGDQSLLLVSPADWPHGQPRGGPAGVLGYDLLRRFIVELDVDGRRLVLHRPRGLDIDAMMEVQRLAVLDRVPYFEAWLDRGQAQGRWLRLQFEPAGLVVGVDYEGRRIGFRPRD
jgi:5'-nucleotidase